MANLERETELLRIELAKSEQSRRELQQTIVETSDQVKNESLNTQNLFGKILAEKNQSDERVKEMVKRLEEEQSKSEKLKAKYQKSESDLAEFTIRVKNFKYVFEITLFFFFKKKSIKLLFFIKSVR